MSRRSVLLTVLLVFLLAIAAVFGFLKWKNTGDVAADKNTDSPAAKLTDEQLLELLATAPLAPPDIEFLDGEVTHFSDNCAEKAMYGRYATNDGSRRQGDFQNGVCSAESVKFAFGAPLIADVDDDGIRDVVALVHSEGSGRGGYFACDQLAPLWTPRIVVYTPVKDGSALEILAYDDFDDVNQDFNFLFEKLVSSSKNADYSWFYTEDNFPEGQHGWVFPDVEPGGDYRASLRSDEPILGFEDGHITAKMTRQRDDSIEPEEVYLQKEENCSYFTENYTVSFEIHKDKLVPVDARKG